MKRKSLKSWETTKIVRGYRWINEIPLNKSYPDLRVNFLDYWEIRDGKEFNFSWITEIPLTKSNVEFVMRGGRSRCILKTKPSTPWRIKNYEFEHNFGHGKQYLATVLAMLMIAGFSDWSSAGIWVCFFPRRPAKRFHSRTSLWDENQRTFHRILYWKLGGIMARHYRWAWRRRFTAQYLLVLQRSGGCFSFLSLRA